MQTAYNAESIVDAQIAKDALEHAGIPAFITGAALMGGIGRLPVQGIIRVLVPDVAIDSALKVLSEVFPDRASARARTPGGEPAWVVRKGHAKPA